MPFALGGRIRNPRIALRADRIQLPQILYGDHGEVCGASIQFLWFNLALVREPVQAGCICWSHVHCAQHLGVGEGARKKWLSKGQRFLRPRTRPGLWEKQNTSINRPTDKPTNSSRQKGCYFNYLHEKKRSLNGAELHAHANFEAQAPARARDSSPTRWARGKRNCSWPGDIIRLQFTRSPDDYLNEPIIYPTGGPRPSSTPNPAIGGRVY